MSQQWIIGKKQTGKSTYLLRQALGDIYDGKTVAWFGSEEILSYIPKKHRERTILFDPSDTEYPIGFNPITDADRFVETVKGLHAMDISAPNLTLFLTAAVLSIKPQTIPNIPRFFLDKDFRGDQIMANVESRDLRDFWEWFDHLSDRDKNSLTSSTLNKVYQFVIDDQMRNIVAQKDTLDLNDLKDKILIVPLKRTDKMSLLGSLIISSIHHSGFTGTFYLDNGHRFAPRVIMDLIEDDTSLFFANHYLAQLDDQLRDCLIGMVGTVVAFRLGVNDAQTLREAFAIEDGANSLYHSLEQLAPFQAHIVTPERLIPQQPMPKTDRPLCPTSPRMIRDSSRMRYAKSRKKVEKLING